MRSSILRPSHTWSGFSESDTSLCAPANFKLRLTSEGPLILAEVAFPICLGAASKGYNETWFLEGLLIENLNLNFKSKEIESLETLVLCSA